MSPPSHSCFGMSPAYRVREPRTRAPRRQPRAALLVLAWSLCGLAHPAAQAAYVCTGKVKQLTTDPGGGVTLSLAGDGVSLSWQILCSVSDTFEGVSPAACRAILMTLKEAEVTQRQVTFSFDYSYS